ncbi:cyclic 2,3-diphosphoglycerate synthase [Candidatus Leptofilum sp.]|uniref:cyclic 2,3-diphosphoglycerate synthase n=1 Tax=Candidatus Leptofilum sp. TaxID=3241576 RepID=UPI003B58CEEC
MPNQKRQRVLIMGAAGRDFHDFNTALRHNDQVEVVAFTATQIPNIDGRRYPPELSGPLYPEGIPIYPEDQLEDLIRQHQIDDVYFSYSDVSHEYVMHLASRVLAAGAGFRLMNPRLTMLKSSKPIVSICAVRTGCGKSQTSRYVLEVLQKELGFKNVVAVRHPMPYGNLAAQAVQRFATYEDMDRHDCTIEEREEYEPYVERGAVIYAGVDYEAILREAEKEADIIIWDGGNNDLPFYLSDFHIVVTDPHRPGHELRYHPGETNLRLAAAVILNKVDTADFQNVLTVQDNIRSVNPDATVIQAASPIFVDDPAAIRGKRVLVVEDGPTLTHGEMAYGAGVVAAQKFGAAEILDPRPFAVRSIAATYQKYPGTGTVLPAMGYGGDQIADLEETINRSDAELVIIATPIDLGKIVNIKLPSQRVRYEYQGIGQPALADLLKERFG